MKCVICLLPSKISFCNNCDEIKVFNKIELSLENEELLNKEVLIHLDKKEKIAISVQKKGKGELSYIDILREKIKFNFPLFLKGKYYQRYKTI